MLRGVHQMLSTAPASATGLSSEILLNFIGVLPEGASPAYETPPGLGYLLELRVFREDGQMRLDWWYDTNRLDRYTIEELTEQFRLALFEMTSDAAAPM